LEGFGGELFDVSSMSEILSQGDEKRAMPAERYERIQHLNEKLEAALHELDSYAPSSFVEDFSQEVASHVARFEEVADRFARLIALVRTAELEFSAQFEERHKELLENFDWRDLDNEEAALCPTPLVVVQAEPNSKSVTKVLELVSTGCPLKVLYLRSGVEYLQGVEGERGRATVLKANFQIETLPIALHGVYFLQCLEETDTFFVEHVEGALRTPRPAVLSLFQPGGVEKPSQDHALLAVQSRAFPQFVHDPDNAPLSVAAVQFLENPQEEDSWVQTEVKSLGDGGVESTLTYRVTFADFVAVAARELFEPLSQEIPSNQCVLLADYLELPRKERARKVPYIVVTSEEGKFLKLRVPPSVITATVQRMQLWGLLQELSGVSNPFVIASEKKLTEAFKSEKEEALTAVKSEMDAKAQGREQVAVQTAITNLAKKLTGMSGDIPAAALSLSIPSGALPSPVGGVSATAANGASATEAPTDAPEAGEEAWIESDECTSCDDCVSLNSQIFGYNENKKAIVKNARGGPYKDIVRAAEKCPAMVIHPGQPQDPNEKGLDKLIARAAKFQ
jgi:pyruvate-ferredoxin/flavodoxin oxidoreductase